MTVTPNHLGTIEVGEPGDNPRIVPAYVASRQLAANVAKSFAIPSTAQTVRLCSTDNTFYSFTTTAAVPGDADDGTACELIKQQGDDEWLIIPPNATTLSVISAGTPIVTASFYA